MSASRLVVAVLVAASAVTAPAYAAPKKPKPVCHLVKDGTGDAMAYRTGQPQTYDPSLDILSLDVNANATTMTVVIRVKDLTEDSQVAPFGRTWTMSVVAPTKTLDFRAYTSQQGGDHFTYGKGTLDYAKNEIRMHATLSELAVKLPKGALLRGFYATSAATVAYDPAWGVGSGFSGFGATDQTDPTKAAFKVGSLSCVKVGV